MIKKFIAFAAAVILSGAAATAQKIVFMPHWLPQAQFAGYYAAIENGFYSDEGLDVEVRHLNANTMKKPTAYLKSGDINVTSLMLIDAMEAVDSGMELVNILQTSQTSGLWCVSKNPVTELKDMEGFKVAKWTTGHSEFAMMAADKQNVSLEWISLINIINAFIAGATDATLCYSFNEYIQLYLATGKDWSAHTIKFADNGYDFPDDGLYVTAEFYDRYPEESRKFARASRKGWEWAAAHPEDAVEICMKYMKAENVSTSRIHQRLMLDEVIRLQKEKSSGKATFNKVSREVFDDLSEKAISAGLLFNKPDYDKMFRP